ncbi:MAG: nuclear transport factor 2 family protein [Thermoleophilaceae bacterium]
MSERSVEIVTEAIDAFNRRDAATLGSLASADLQFTGGVIGARTYRGPEGTANFLRDVDAAWSEFRIVVDHVSDLGDVVVVYEHVIGKGRTTGAPVQHGFFVVMRVEEGKITETEAFLSEAEALGAVALRD